MGFAATLINGGSLSNAFGSMLKGALFGAVSAGIANEIGNWAGGLEGVGDGHSLSFFTEGSFVPALAKAAMHGIARGVIDTIQGGKFGAGFASGFVSSGFAVSQKWGTVESRTIVMAMVGGTTSQITGGKFANGAITGAFVHLFNAEAVISSTYRAVKHYFNGSGDMVELASETKLELVNSPEVRAQSQALRNGAAKVLNGNFGVELMWDTFHVGDTGVVFNTYCSSSICTTSYVGFVQVLHGGSVATSPDSFSDPIDMGFELYGGKPYYYMPHSWTETYPNKF
jgi:hypothetical protein